MRRRPARQPDASPARSARPPRRRASRRTAGEGTPRPSRRRTASRHDSPRTLAADAQRDEQTGVSCSFRPGPDRRVALATPVVTTTLDGRAGPSTSAMASVSHDSPSGGRSPRSRNFTSTWAPMPVVSSAASSCVEPADPGRPVVQLGPGESTISRSRRPCRRRRRGTSRTCRRRSGGRRTRSSRRRPPPSGRSRPAGPRARRRSELGVPAAVGGDQDAVTGHRRHRSARRRGLRARVVRVRRSERLAVHAVGVPGDPGPVPGGRVGDAVQQAGDAYCWLSKANGVVPRTGGTISDPQISSCSRCRTSTRRWPSRST